MTQPLIEAVDVVQQLGKGAGRVRALKGVSLALAGGELTLLMGPWVTDQISLTYTACSVVNCKIPTIGKLVEARIPGAYSVTP